MLTLVNILIVFFITLIVFQLFLANHIREGLETSNTYKSYNTNNETNALILAQQNAGNIGYLNDKIKEVQPALTQIQDLSGNVQTLQTQVNGLVTAQQQYATQLTGGSAPNITGATESNADSSDDSSDDNSS
jgi:hypothetical protein